MPRSNEEYSRLAAALYEELCAAKFNVEELTKLGEAIFAEVKLQWAVDRKKIPPSALAKLFRLAQRLDAHYSPEAPAVETAEPTEVAPATNAPEIAPAASEEIPAIAEPTTTAQPEEQAVIASGDGQQEPTEAKSPTPELTIPEIAAAPATTPVSETAAVAAPTTSEAAVAPTAPPTPTTGATEEKTPTPSAILTPNKPEAPSTIAASTSAPTDQQRGKQGGKHQGRNERQSRDGQPPNNGKHGDDKQAPTPATAQPLTTTSPTEPVTAPTTPAKPPAGAISVSKW
jgi:hypothetical protein